jgi:two-component system, chemotaxis family, sensor kinase CheA
MDTVAGGKKSYKLIGLIRKRLWLVMSLFIFTLVFRLFVSGYELRSQDLLSEQKLSLHDNINTLLNSMIDEETGLRGYITTNDSTFLAPFNEGHPQYLYALQNMQTIDASNNLSATTAALSQVEISADDWYNNFALPQIRNMQTGHADQARSIQTTTKGKSLFDAFRQAVASLQQAADHDMAVKQGEQDAGNTVATIITVLLAILAISVLWKAFTGFASSLHVQLDMLRETSTRLGRGDYVARVQRLSYDELDLVGQTFNHMADAIQQQQKALKERDVLENVIQLSTIFTKTLSFDALAQEFLNTVLTSLDLQLAVIYLYETNADCLKLAAAQGLTYQRVQKEFRLGEGTIGRAGLNRIVIHTTEPTDEEMHGFQVKTIYGDAIPRSLYALPLELGEELLGVLGVGSLYLITEKALNVLSVVTSNLSSAISNTRSYQHIRKQAEELAQRSREQEQANAELRMQRDKLTSLNEALEEANRARSRFLSTMSHELRTPLASIIGFSQILLDDIAKNAANAHYKRNLERIRKNGNYLLAMINDVLDLSKMDAGRMEVSNSTVNVKELITSVIEQAQSIATTQGLKLTWSVEEGVEGIETDQEKLHRVLLNLVSNAIKFTSEGEVSIKAMRLPVEQGVDKIALAVKDTGIGISPEEQQHIFEAFYQVESGSTRKYGGTGLGLSIVYELTDLLGGTIELESTPGKGSIFTVSLPVKAQKVQAIETTRALLQSGKPHRGGDGGRTVS